MTNQRLMVLASSARVILTDEFRCGQTSPDFSEHQAELNLGRIIDLSVLDGLIDHAMKRPAFDAAREASDGWLAPRLHATLRFRRAEAADRRVWSWLAVVRYAGYVRWRFPSEDGTTIKRFLGQDRDNAISRLWWGAELTRDGSDYSSTVTAFDRQDIPNTWLALDAFHNRPAALAALRMLPTMGARPINALAKAFNHYLTTVMLDSVAPMRAPDSVAFDEWIAKKADLESLVEDALPAGPDEDPVEPALIDAVEALVRRVASDVGIAL